MSVPGLLITGTDTEVGKTFVTASILRGLTSRGIRAGALKPIATGYQPDSAGTLPEDTRQLIDALGDPASIPPELVTPITFEEPLAPPVAARRAGLALSRSRVFETTDRAVREWGDRCEVLIVEGIGGLLCPIAEATTLADLAAHLDYPLIIVSRIGLGTMNHTLLTVEAALMRGLRVAGVVMTQATPGQPTIADETNPGELSRWLNEIPILAVIEYQSDIKRPPAGLAAIDWLDRARPSRRAISR